MFHFAVVLNLKTSMQAGKFLGGFVCFSTLIDKTQNRATRKKILLATWVCLLATLMVIETFHFWFLLELEVCSEKPLRLWEIEKLQRAHSRRVFLISYLSLKTQRVTFLLLLNSRLPFSMRCHTLHHQDKNPWLLYCFWL